MDLKNRFNLMRKVCFLLMPILFLFALAGCSDEEKVTIPAPEISGMESEYVVLEGSELELSPIVTNTTEATFRWLLDGKEVATTQRYLFHTTLPGEYKLVFEAINPGGKAQKEVLVKVMAKETPPSGETIYAQTQAYTLLSLETPGYFPDESTGIQWEVTSSPSTLYRLSYADTKNPLFVAAEEGEYTLTVTDGNIEGVVQVTVAKREKQPSAFISEVFDYLPAPGQFVNELPKYETGDTQEDMVRKAGEWIVGEDAWMITLGGWGGYVVFGFDHTIVNVPGKRDFRVNGNAFGAALGRPGAPFGGSCEPGIIMVAYDKNKNGKPDDDEWYEIKGSANFTAENEAWYQMAVDNGNDVRVFRDYEMTYHKPKSEKPEADADPDNPNAYVSIQNYIYWEDNQNGKGYKVKNVYHNQSYYPAWMQDEKLTYTGIRLPQNGINEGKYVPGINDGDVYYVLYGFLYGYVDNHPNVSDESAIDIDWAIDKEGNKADLPGIDFVKVYNGVNQENGWLGETSTEVERGEDLHLLGKSIDTGKD